MSAAIDANFPFPREHLYWDVVRRALNVVFGLNSEESATAVNPLIERINDRPTEERLLFYHSEPLDVATDLVGEQPNDTQIAKYKTLLKEFHWVP